MNHFDWWGWNSYCNAYRLVNKWIRHCPGAAAGLPIKATSTSWNGPWESPNITTLSVELRSKRWSKIIRADFTRAWSNVRKRRRRFISWVTSRIVFRRKSCEDLKYQNVFFFVYDSFLDRQTGVSCPFWADRCRTSSSANSTSVSVTYRRPAADL
jgi:hypothetical protein